MELQVHSFPTSVVDWCEWSASCPGLFLAGKDPPPRYQLNRRLGWPRSQTDLAGRSIKFRKMWHGKSLLGHCKTLTRSTTFLGLSAKAYTVHAHLKTVCSIRNLSTRCALTRTHLSSPKLHPTYFIRMCHRSVRSGQS